MDIDPLIRRRFIEKDNDLVKLSRLLSSSSSGLPSLDNDAKSECFRILLNLELNVKQIIQTYQLNSSTFSSATIEERAISDDKHRMDQEIQNQTQKLQEEAEERKQREEEEKKCQEVVKLPSRGYLNHQIAELEQEIQKLNVFYRDTSGEQRSRWAEYVKLSRWMEDNEDLYSKQDATREQNLELFISGKGS